jgi:hypothetical protein
MALPSRSATAKTSVIGLAELGNEARRNRFNSLDQRFATQPLLVSLFLSQMRAAIIGCMLESRVGSDRRRSALVVLGVLLGVYLEACGGGAKVKSAPDGGSRDGASAVMDIRPRWVAVGDEFDLSVVRFDDPSSPQMDWDCWLPAPTVCTTFRAPDTKIETFS